MTDRCSPESFRRSATWRGWSRVGGDLRIAVCKPRHWRARIDARAACASARASASTASVSPWSHSPTAAFEADVSQETLRVTTLADNWPWARRVNLEPALRAGDPLGGHWMSGHVDGGRQWSRVAERRAFPARGVSRRRRIWRATSRAKGSVALDGVSLTVNTVAGRQFTVNLIPHTARGRRTSADLARGTGAESRGRHARPVRGARTGTIRMSTGPRLVESAPAFDRIEDILADLAAGRMVVIVDDEDRENEGDLLMAAQMRAARRHQLHGALRPRPDLPHADRANAARSCACR